MKSTPVFLAALLVSLTPVTLSLAVDWPQWRGPARSGVVMDPKHQISALASEPKVLWKIKVGDGHASPVAAGNRVVFLDAQEGQEVAHCLDAQTGQTLWTQPVAPLVDFSNFGAGPRCTPLIEEDRVYVQSSSGEFRCLSLADGQMRWQINFEKDYGATFLGNASSNPEAKEAASRRHGNNGSAAIDGARIFVPVGSPKGATLVAFDKLTGQELWRAGKDNTAYASVMVATLAGVRQAVHFTADALMGVECTSGKILWRQPLKTGAKRHVCTPVISGDTITVCSTNIGTLNFKIVKEGEDFAVNQVWANLQLKTILGTPVLAGKYLYTLGGGSRTDVVCVDFATGQSVWSQGGFGDYASLTVVNDKLFVLNATGELILLKASPEKYEELGRAQVCGKTYSSPAYLDGTLIVKDDGSLSAIRVAE